MARAAPRCLLFSATTPADRARRFQVLDWCIAAPADGCSMFDAAGSRDKQGPSGGKRRKFQFRNCRPFDIELVQTAAFTVQPRSLFV